MTNMRRSGGNCPDAFSPDMSSSGSGSSPRSVDHDLIRKAQLEAAARRSLTSEHALSADQLCGTWTDSYGNTVNVYSTDAYQMRLCAMLVKHGRRDINLPLLPSAGGCGWHCGGGTMVASSDSQVWWAFPTGSVSVWTRCQTGANLSQSDLPAQQWYPACQGQVAVPVAQPTQVWMPVWMPACA